MEKAVKAVVVGSLHYDIFVEAPHRPAKGETVMGFKWYPKFGGKGGNQAVAAARAGCAVTMVSAVGTDSFAPGILRVLHEHGIATDHVQEIAGTGSGMSVAIADSEGDYGAVVVSGANRAMDNSRLDNDELFADAKMLILQNEVADETNIAAARAAKKRGVPVCINAAPAKPMPADLAPLIDILIVNQVEAAEISGLKVDSLAEAQSAAAKLAESYKMVIVTAGSEGVAYAGDGGCGALPAHKVKVVSTHGAGDCFVGQLCAHLCQGFSLEESVSFANQKAAEHVSTVHQDALL
ncbi:MAG: ribokinase [Proteobacteria bacterium]|uniref:Ribokinase n=1 Tax=Candidatus Avisuccinivibrio stercorigallinarum TaxID=2840704 RepID=A0A9D9DBN8_9GAMM|nr:ribokinase [Candidatus Avisuccinivibrio stercorigallinarum]